MVFYRGQYRFAAFRNDRKLSTVLLSVIDKVKEYNLNTIVFQVRPCNDALYQSDLNPWSEFITGKQGAYPGSTFSAGLSRRRRRPASKFMPG